MSGMPGIGKSVLTSALVRDRRIREAFPDGIIWVCFGQQSNPVDLQRKVHTDLGGDGAIQTVRQGRNKLTELLVDKKVLLILDNVWQRSDVDAFDVLGPRCRAIITTRETGLLTSLGGDPYVVELLTKEEAAALLANTVGLEPDKMPAEAGQLVVECGRLPLAVALAGGMINEGTPWRDLIDALRNHRLEFLEDEYSDQEDHRNLWRTIEVSVFNLPQHDQERLAELAVFPADEQIPEAAVLRMWAKNFGEAEGRRLLVKLKQRSLLQLVRIPDTAVSSVGELSLHDLIHHFCVRLAERFFGAVSKLHEHLLEAYRGQCRDGWASGPKDGYFFQHLRDHLQQAGRGPELADLLHNLRWLEVKAEQGLTFDLPFDFSAALGSVPREEMPGRRLALLEKALHRDIHFIHRHRQDYPQGLFQCLWNSCWWLDSPDAASFFTTPDKAPPRELPSTGLADLLERWRQAKSAVDPGVIWLRSVRPFAAATRAIFRGHTKAVKSVACFGDGFRIVSGSLDATVPSLGHDQQQGAPAARRAREGEGGVRRGSFQR